MMEAQAGWIAQVARRIADGRPPAVDVRPEVAERLRRRDAGPARPAACGRAATAGTVDGGRITTNWPGLVSEYQRRTATVDWSELEEVS